MSNLLSMGWGEASINDFIKENSLYSDGDWVETKDQDSEGPNRLIQLGDIGDGLFLNKSRKYMSDEQFTRLRCTELKEGDLLIARMPDPIGRACIFPKINQRCATVVDIAILRNPKANVYWLMSMINSSQFRRKIEIHSIGTTRIRVTRGLLAKLKFFTPKITSQNKIADILLSIDQAIEKTEALIHKYQQIKAGLMHDLFTRGVTADGKLRPPREQVPELYKKTPIGWIPKEWEVKKTGDLCTSIVPGRDKPILDGGELPWITVTDIEKLTVYESLEGLSLSIKSLKSANGHLIPKGSVIMSCVGFFGLVAIAGKELVINQQLHAFIHGDKILPEWLTFCLKWQAPYMSKIATQTTIPYINKDGCESIPIFVPQKNEQQQIVDRILKIYDSIFLEQEIVSKLQKQKTGLMHDLLTGKVQVSVN